MRLCFDPPSCGSGVQACFQRVFQKVGQYGAEVNFQYRKLIGQVKLKGKRDALLYFGKIFFQTVPLFLSGEALHRKIQVKSVLEDIPGVGEVRRKALMRHFKSIEEMKAASVSEFAKIPEIPERLAEDIYLFFMGKTTDFRTINCTILL